MSSHNTKKPTGGENVRRVVEPPDPNDHLLEQILSRKNMHKAWKQVKANKGAPGIDNMSWLLQKFPLIGNLSFQISYTLSVSLVLKKC